jgi:hypothetical protein
LLSNPIAQDKNQITNVPSATTTDVTEQFTTGITNDIDVAYSQSSQDNVEPGLNFRSVSIAASEDESMFSYQTAVIGQTLSIASPKGVPAGYKLAVGGNIIASGINIKPIVEWPDYVFDDTYNLPGIKQVEIFIKKNGHLPGIPSAKEMEEKENYGVAEMDALLLKKIEELTLYTIQLKQEINNRWSTSESDTEHSVDSIISGSSSLTGSAAIAGVISELINSHGNKPVFSSARANIAYSNFLPTNFEKVTVTNTLSIGTSLPVPKNYKLAVGGNILATGIDLQVPQKWPDYVFANEYPLPTIEEVKSFIRENGHLPNVLSAKQMYSMENYNVAEMDAKLMEKVEELMLYIIELESAIAR